MNTVSPIAPAIETIEHLPILMPDGVRLSARVWRPADRSTGPLPALVEYIPYRKGDLSRARDERCHSYFAAHGYVSLRIDMRGSGDSEGLMADMYMPDELSDIRHAIDWIAEQTWCDGSVGMFGTSWGGTAGLQASLDPPKALKAVIAVCATHDRFRDDIHYMGGLVQNDSIEWGAALPAILALPPTPEALGDNWRAEWQHRLDNLAFPLENWLREGSRNAYWKRGSVIDETDRIGCPILAVGGWSDRYSNSVMSLVDACPDKVWGIVGPWGHHYPDQGHPGPALGFQQTALEWWDRWLKPANSDAPDWPKLRVWLREYDPPRDVLEIRNGCWIESGPPSAETQRTDLHFSHDGGFSQSPPSRSAAWPVPFDLLHGQASGDTGYFGRYGGLPLPQDEDDIRALVFETEPLADDLVLFGETRIELGLEGDTGAGQICVRVNDVNPEGASSRVGFAVLNLALEDSLETANRTNGDEPRTVRLRLPTNAYRFKAGHRIRLAVGSSYWPTVWTPARRCETQVLFGRLSLPILRRQPEPLRDSFPAPTGNLVADDVDILAAPLLKRDRVTLPDGNAVTRWHQPETATLYHGIGTIFRSESRSETAVKPGMPESARTEITHRMQVARPDGTAEATSTVNVRCGPDALSIDAKLDVFWNEQVVARKHWTFRAPRNPA